MATHVLRPKLWAMQFQELLPTLKSGDRIYAPTLQAKIAIDVLCDAKQDLCDKVNTYYVDRAAPGNVCLRCRAALVRGYPHPETKCMCSYHAQDCPRLWYGASNMLRVAAMEGMTLTEDSLSVADHYGRQDCTCGADDLLKRFNVTPEEYTHAVES